ncbi:protein kinase [Streptomyces sp. NPDC127063]|uniref:serine/threonine-protein kinase n=1 Tax=Streptomyces sp. NPDC127063 TaxID=3347123 RepID=UPI00365271C9
MEKLGPGDPHRIGAYRLLARLGAGGMGQVYLARSDRGRTVAVKLVREELAAQEEFRARFRQEVQAARRVGGYWTAPVLDADTEAPVPWVATGYVAGPSLERVVGHDHGALPERSVRILAAGLAHALRDIHAAGIVHRDLKPSNVLVTIDGPRVIDFGIARALETPAREGLTRTGSLVGSPGFMAPEQVRGERITPACDVFCLGSVLAYAATGTLPFGSATSGAHALMYRIAQEEPDLEGVPEGIADLVRQCLRKDPAARPALEHILDITGAEDTVTDGRSRDPWLPSALVAQLGRHAVRLLDTEAPEGTAGTAPLPTGTPTGPASEPTPDAASGATPGVTPGAVPGAGSGATPGAVPPRPEGVPGGAPAHAAPASGGAPGAVVDQRGGVPGAVVDQRGGVPGAVADRSGHVPGAVADQAGRALGAVPEQPGRAPGAVPEHGSPGEAAGGTGGLGPREGLTGPPPPGQPGYLPTMVAGESGAVARGVGPAPAAPAQTPPHGHPQAAPYGVPHQPGAQPGVQHGQASGAPGAYGGPGAYGYQHPQSPGAYGYPQQAGAWNGLGGTPPYGPPPFGQEEPPRRNGRSTLLLVLIALVVALAAGGSVYAFMSGDARDPDPGPTTTPTTSTTSTAPSPGPTGDSASPSPGNGTVPEAYLGTWTATIENATGVNTRVLTIRQGEVGDTVLTLVAEGPAGTGSYHCEFTATLTRTPAPNGPLQIGPSTVTTGEPASACTPGAPTEVTLLPDGHLERLNTTTNEKLTYTRQN